MRSAAYSILFLAAAVTGFGAPALAGKSPPAAPHKTGAKAVAHKPAVKAPPPRKAAPKAIHKAAVRKAPKKMAAHRPPPKPVKAAERKRLRRPVRRVARTVSHSIALPLDEVRVVAFSQPISTVYVGNPSIADVSMIDARHAFILGKSFGGTNIVALDANGRQVVNDQISVYARSGMTVTLHRGAKQVTYACAGPRCEATPVPGDDKESFASSMDQIEKHQDMGLKAAAAGH